MYDGSSEQLAAWGRSFPYLNEKGVYSVSFMVDEFTEKPELQVLFCNAGVSTYSDKPAEKISFSAQAKDFLKSKMWRKALS